MGVTVLVSTIRKKALNPTNRVYLKLIEIQEIIGNAIQRNEFRILDLSRDLWVALQG